MAPPGFLTPIVFGLLTRGQTTKKNPPSSSKCLGEFYTFEFVLPSGNWNLVHNRGRCVAPYRYEGPLAFFPHPNQAKLHIVGSVLVFFIFSRMSATVINHFINLKDASLRLGTKIHTSPGSLTEPALEPVVSTKARKEMAQTDLNLKLVEAPRFA